MRCLNFQLNNSVGRLETVALLKTTLLNQERRNMPDKQEDGQS
jgi:hypothetical protein